MSEQLIKNAAGIGRTITKKITPIEKVEPNILAVEGRVTTLEGAITSIQNSITVLNTHKNTAAIHVPAINLEDAILFGDQSSGVIEWKKIDDLVVSNVKLYDSDQDTYYTLSVVNGTIVLIPV